MRRRYVTKGEAALHGRITIPLSKPFLEKLTKAAAEAGKQRTTFARDLLEKGLGRK